MLNIVLAGTVHFLVAKLHQTRKDWQRKGPRRCRVQCKKEGFVHQCINPHVGICGVADSPGTHSHVWVFTNHLYLCFCWCLSPCVKMAIPQWITDLPSLLWYLASFLFHHSVPIVKSMWSLVFYVPLGICLATIWRERWCAVSVLVGFEYPVHTGIFAVLVCQMPCTHPGEVHGMAPNIFSLAPLVLE